jgi:chromosome segregation ATPase
MKKICLLSILTSVAMICACQKKDSAAQEQPAQVKTELAAREGALTERLDSLEEKVNSLNQRVKELAAKENAAANLRTSSTNVQSRPSDPAQVQAERDRMVQQLATMIPRPSQAAGDPAKQPRPAQRQLGPEDLQRQWQSRLNNPKMAGEAVFPAAEPASPTPSPAAEATSPSPSPTPE